MGQATLTPDYRSSPFYDPVSRIYSYPLYFGLAGNRYRRDVLYVSNKTSVPLIYRWDLESNTSTVLTPGEEPVCPIFGGMSLHYDQSVSKAAFTKDTAGNMNHNICIVDFSTKDTETISRSPMGTVLFLFWAKDGKLVLVGHDAASVYVKELAMDGSTRDLYSTDQQITGACYDHKLNIVAFVVGRGQGSRIGLLNVSDPSDIKWTREIGLPPFNPPTVNPETGLLAYTIDTPIGQELSIVSVENLEQVKRIPIPGTGFLEWLDGNRLFGAVLKDGRLAPQILDVRNGNWSGPLVQESALWTTVTRNGPVWVANGLSLPPYLQMLKEGGPVNLTSPANLAGFNAESEWFTSFDSRKVHGWLLRSPLPHAKLVVYLHGGPTALQGDWWYPEIPALVLGGFHVFAPNFRGSDGYGAEFRDLNIGDLGGGDLRDVVYSARHAQKVLGLSGEKPAVVGGSYGGYLTLMALTCYPDDWMGGVAIAPPTDYADEYKSDDAHYRKWCENFFRGTPEEKGELYRDRSPITHLDRLRSSVLIIAGENDSIVTLNSVKRFTEEALKMHLPVRLVISKNEGHGSLQNTNMIRDTVLMLDHLKSIYTQS